MLFQELKSVEDVVVPDDAPLMAELAKTGPLNLPWAREVMERRGVDALVLGDPINVYHVTGHWPFSGRTRPGAPPTMFVIVTRDPAIPPALVSARFYYFYTFVDGNFDADRPVFIWGPEGGFEDRGDEPLDLVETNRNTRLAKSLEQRAASQGMTQALATAMRDLHVADGHVAYDYERIPDWLSAEGVTPQWEQADDILRHVRLVKSPLEIALMKQASAINMAAIHATMAAAREGMSHRDFRRRFFAEAALRGSQGVTLTVDRSSNEEAGYELVRGNGVMLDCVTKFKGYHGDYGRTFFVGEPRAPMKKAVEAITIGWEAAREALKPGVKYSEIVAIGRDAVKKAGHDFVIAFTPHSIGLLHTDEPIDWTSGQPGKHDLTLREGMILSVDCPVLETGFGGSAHVEDLSLITKDGSERIHPGSGTAFIL